MNQQSEIDAHCNECGGQRAHIVLHTERTRWEAEEGSVWGGETWQTLKCGGCKSIKLLRSQWNSEQDHCEEQYFPPTMFKKHPDWFYLLDLELGSGEKFVETLLNEVYVALHNNLPNLAAMGIRALLEKMMISKTGDRGSFEENMAAFEDMGYVSKIQRKRMAAILEAGHAAIHRSFAPNSADIVTLLDITEHIIETVYIHERPVELLAKRVPPRPPRVRPEKKTQKRAD